MNKKGLTYTQLLAAGLFIIALGILAERYLGLDIDGLIPSKPVQLRTLTPKEVLSLPRPVKIPAQVYENNTKRSAWAGVLFDDKKAAFFVYGGGCPYAKRFKRMFSTVLKRPELAASYKKVIRNTGVTGFVTCNTAHCAKIYLLETCGNGFCIINPKTREIIVDNSQDPAVAAALLEKYRNW